MTKYVLCAVRVFACALVRSHTTNIVIDEEEGKMFIKSDSASSSLMFFVIFLPWLFSTLMHLVLLLQCHYFCCCKMRVCTSAVWTCKRGRAWARSVERACLCVCGHGTEMIYNVQDNG